ncbi:MAG TPA: MFS transporter [Steroidobacteraceae bacterium]|nr:MFS transporter [Steroidobacteraceae bacterium]
MSDTHSELGQRTLRKVAWRLIPFMGLLYFLAFVDRVNIGFAALTMNADLGLTPSMFGFASGIFFIGYVLFEVPSNIVMERVGARLWIARIMITWGLLSASTAFVSSPNNLYVLRFLLGVAEAGFFPGMILYLTYWFPAASRGRIVGAFMMALPISTVIGSPVSTAMLSLNAFGLHGWQLMFLAEGIPALLCGFVVLGVLRDGPARAAWLTDEERNWLSSELAAERAALGPVSHSSLAGLREPRVWFLGLVYFGMLVGTYGVGFWLPQIVKRLGNLSNFEVGLTTALPYAIAAATMYLWGRHSDRTRERTWHVALAAFVGALGLALSAYWSDMPVLAFAALCLSVMGSYSALPVFWTLPTSMFAGSAAAACIALVNSIGNNGGFFGPTLVGFVTDATGSFTAALWTLAAFVAAAGILVLALAPRTRALVATSETQPP